MRVKSRWFRAGSRTPGAVAGAVAFIAWRIAQNALKNMRAAGYELRPGDVYFDFTAAFLAYLAVGADRLAYRRGDDAWRIAFTTALVHRMGEILAENESELLGAAGAADIKRAFIALVNECSAQCEGFAWNDDGPDYGLLRYFGHRIADVMNERDRTWAVSQVIEIEAPEAAKTLVRGMTGLLDESPRRRDRSTHATGE